MKKELNNQKAKQERITKRMSRIEGQFRGIRRMFEEKRECIDIIQQITAVRQALTMLGIELLKDEFVCKRASKKGLSEKYLETLFKIK